MQTSVITFGNQTTKPSIMVRQNQDETTKLTSLNPQAYPNLARKVDKYQTVKKSSSNELKSLIDIAKFKPEFKSFEAGFFYEFEKLKNKMYLSQKVEFLDFLENSTKIIKEVGL